ncbi:phosphatase PAP2 family protein [Desulfofustis glycolicus]|nr:phosphatase PAP2 family protein [Desulfofustis glycolicus]MCB2218695.1 phosphatase PAP2 family protein [Desulfobulbaceae bacterium]
MMDLFFRTITWGGSLMVLLPLALLISLLFYARGRIGDAALLLGGLLGASLFVHILKRLFARPRPEVENLLVAMPPDFSFPSAHTGQAVAFSIACALILSRQNELTGALVIWGMLLAFAVLVGVSRVYLQVHYLSDVLVGALLGGCWVLLLSRLLGLWLPRS